MITRTMMIIKIDGFPINNSLQIPTLLYSINDTKIKITGCLLHNKVVSENFFFLSQKRQFICHAKDLK